MESGGGLRLSADLRRAQSRGSDLMQHLDDAHEQAEAWMASWLISKRRNWRALLVKDVLARLRVVLWCPDRSWESSRREVDEHLNEVASDYWSKSVLPGRDPQHPDGAWQEQAWSAARRHDTTDRLRMLGPALVEDRLVRRPPRSRHGRCARRALRQSRCSIRSRVEPAGRRRSRLRLCIWPRPANGSRCSTPTWMHLASGLCSPVTMAPSPRVGSPITSWSSVFWETRPVSIRRTTITGMRLMAVAGLERSSFAPRVASIADTWKARPNRLRGVPGWHTASLRCAPAADP